MKYHVITIGKIKEKYLTAGIDEFLKRLRPYGQVEVTVLPEEKMPENPSPAQKAQVLDKEGEKMLRHVRQGSHLFALDVQGKLVSSEDLAASFAKLALYGCSEISFIIGGPLRPERPRPPQSRQLHFLWPYYLDPSDDTPPLIGTNIPRHQDRPARTVSLINKALPVEVMLILGGAFS